MSLGENLQRLRKDKGLSQEEVAQRLYVSRQSVSKWELDQAEPGFESLKALAALYGVTLDALAGAAPPPPPEEEAPNEPAADPEKDTELLAVYLVVLGVRTAAFLAENLLFTWPYLGRLDLPFDWMLMLVGLATRRWGIWMSIVVLFLVNIGFSLIRLLTMTAPAWGIYGLLLNGLGLYVFYRPEIKDYFHKD